MDVLVYIQCDSRFNSFLLKKIQDKEVIAHVIDKSKQISSSLLCCIYDCEENTELIDFFRKRNDVNLVLSSEPDVTKRFLGSVLTQSGYVVRVGGDQVLLNVEESLKILDKMKEEKYDFYYEDSMENCFLPDVVSIELLKDKYIELIDSDRYFVPLLTMDNIRRLKVNQGVNIVHNCRVRDYLSYIFVKHVIEDRLDLDDINKKLAWSMNTKTSALYQSGILTSWAMGSSSGEFFYDINENINPWWCEAAVYFVRDRIKNLKDLKVFEWGAGNSTFFWSKYANEVVSIEYDIKWYKSIKKNIPPNVDIKYCELEYGGKYCDMINNEDKTFDIILIDGRDRVRCAENCINKINDSGVIVWDDTERDYYREGFEYLKSRGFKQLELSGVLWGNPMGCDSTSIFYRENNILGI